MSDWQPIETAPRDGDLVVVWTEYGCLMAAWSRARLRWEAPEFDGYLTPSHWLQLPPPPSEGPKESPH